MSFPYREPSTISSPEPALSKIPTIAAPGVRDPSRRHLTNRIIKDKVFFEKYASETNGEYSLVHVSVGPGGGTPLHYHNSYAETLTCTSGTLGVVLGEQTLEIPAGETAHIPAGTKHRFFNPLTEGDTYFTARVEPGNEGFEKSVYVIYGLANDGLCDEAGLPKSFVTLCLMAKLGDMKWPGMMASLGNTLVSGVAAYARWSGEEERLLKKYWS